jgi:hypothetical protein
MPFSPVLKVLHGFGTGPELEFADASGPIAGEEVGCERGKSNAFCIGERGTLWMPVLLNRACSS